MYKEILKEIISSHSSKELLKLISDSMNDLSNDYIDFDLKDRAKELSVLSQVFEDISNGKPFLM